MGAPVVVLETGEASCLRPEGSRKKCSDRLSLNFIDFSTCLQMLIGGRSFFADVCSFSQMFVDFPSSQSGALEHCILRAHGEG